MSPLLRGLDVDGLAARLERAGDAEAAGALRSLRDAVAAQDGALRDLVADALELRQDHDEDGVSVVIRPRVDGFEDLAKAFGYPAVEGFDPARHAEAAAGPGGACPYDGLAHLTGLDHLLARIAMDGVAPEELLRLGHVAVEVGHGPGRETLFVWDERRSPTLAEERAAEAPGPAPGR